jgi:alkylation response protein AidB-like acyl-CoA dehydrogenase
MSKLLWGPWHRRLGELAIDVRGADATRVKAPYTLDGDQALFLYSRADTIYAGSDEVQRNIISERMLGLPRG